MDPEPQTDEAGDAAPTTSEHVMDMLGDHVPLSLLMDLTVPQGPDSEQLLDEEGLPADSWWDLADGAEDGATAIADEEEAGEAGTPR